jgi:hypothetical protein
MLGHFDLITKENNHGNHQAILCSESDHPSVNDAAANTRNMQNDNATLQDMINRMK